MGVRIVARIFRTGSCGWAWGHYRTLPNVEDSQRAKMTINNLMAETINEMHHGYIHINSTSKVLRAKRTKYFIVGLKTSFLRYFRWQQFNLPHSIEIKMLQLNKPKKKKQKANPEKLSIFQKCHLLNIH